MMSAPIIVPARHPSLNNGDVMTAATFHRAYRRMPDVKKAELINGAVLMASPVSMDFHSHFDGRVGTILGLFALRTPGLGHGPNPSLYLDKKNVFQADQVLYITPSNGGQVRLKNGYLISAPDLVVEVAATTIDKDLGHKKRIYQKRGVREYLVVRVIDGEIDWFVNRNGQFERIKGDADGIMRSTIFPGLWLDPVALLADDSAKLFDVISRGLASPEHAAFAATLVANAQ